MLKNRFTMALRASMKSLTGGVRREQCARMLSVSSANQR